jgi:Sulfotransferase domain
VKVINLISGPRNLSTALMYSFAQRQDMKVLDEPFYGYYLQNAPVTVSHPSEKEILASLDTNKATIVKHINALSAKSHVFVKGMAHHYLEAAPDFILKWNNIILIRHPEKLLTSFSKVIKEPSLQDIGIKKASEIFTYLSTQGKNPLVIDSDELLKNPSAYLKKICEVLHIPFTTKMLSWKKGGIPEDGVWAKHWYKNVHNSEGFAIQNNKSEPMPKRLQPILEEALSYYTTLKNHILKND